MNKSPSNGKKQKIQTIKRLFDDDWIFLHVDTRHENILVPDHLIGTASVTFKISKLFQGPTEIGQDEITAHLLFGSSRFFCRFPYDAIWGVTSHRNSNIVWPESTPPEVLEQLSARQKSNQAEALEIEGELLKESEKVKPAGKSKPKKGGHLRRIK